MFTGLTSRSRREVDSREGSRGKQLQIVAPRTARKLRVGDSVLVNGCLPHF